VSLAAAVFLARNAVLSSFAVGRQTSLVVDSGHGSTVGKQAGTATECFVYVPYDPMYVPLHCGCPEE